MEPGPGIDDGGRVGILFPQEEVIRLPTTQVGIRPAAGQLQAKTRNTAASRCRRGPQVEPCSGQAQVQAAPPASRNGNSNVSPPQIKYSLNYR